jgi:cellulose synthase/poly-beta-1,6-N-acetylglucosamine synthase-like glycosyltransferase
MNTLLFVASVLVLLFEFQNVLAWSRRRILPQDAGRSDDFTIVVPLYGDPSYFDTGRAALSRYRANTLVAIEVGSERMAAFADELAAEGFGVHRIRMEAPNPASLVTRALDAVETTVTVRLDADTVVGDDLPEAVAGLLAARADLASVKVEAANRRTVIARLQNLEYRIAMLTRHYRPWLTSGACIVGRTAALRRIYAHHSHWTPGEDIETGRAAVALRMRIRHADITVWTAVPDTCLALARQRRLWWAGNFRHAIVNADRNLVHMPVMTIYWLLLIWMSFWFKAWSAIDWSSLPRTLPLIYVAYLLVTVVSNLKVLSRWMVLFPLYAMVQSLIMPAFGIWTYACLASRRRRLGRYRFGYRRAPRIEPGATGAVALEPAPTRA